MRRYAALIPMLLAGGFATWGCMCGDPHLNRVVIDPDSGVAFPVGNPNLNTCNTDCDCPPNEHCAQVGSEIQYNTCVAGKNTCPQPCTPACPSTQKCVSGVCEPKVCPTDFLCPSGQVCVNGTCQAPTCPNNFNCPAGQVCVNGSCQPGCTPNCAGKQCGPDGCGGSCGSCAAGAACNGAGQCVQGCTPKCAGKQCGPDGCGGSCGSCVAGQSCSGTGTCVAACSLTAPYVSVNGAPFATHYSLDISDFTKQEQFISDLLTLLNDLATGQPDCSNTSSNFGIIECLISVVVAANGGLNAPPFVSQLLTTLQALFQFGGQGNTVTASGSMTLVEGTPCPTTLTGTETWTHLYMTYNGVQYDLMNNPNLGGSIGNITVTVDPFSGTRDATNVYLGPRDIHFDVNKFILALIDVAINAATNGQDTDIPSLIDDVLCGQINPISDPTDYFACTAAATAIGNSIDINSGLGGFHFDTQNAAISPTFGTTATDLGTAASPGTVTGQLYNGIISGQLGQPGSTWYGHR